eukprot:7221656-Alexandrium_andersonii.AAC.1
MEQNWNSWKDDANHPRDLDGPRGHLRLYVRTTTKITDFEEVSKEKTLTQEQRMNNKSTEAQLSDKLKQVFSSDGMESHDLSSFAALQAGAKRTLMGTL